MNNPRLRVVAVSTAKRHILVHGRTFNTSVREALARVEARNRRQLRRMGGGVTLPRLGLGNQGGPLFSLSKQQHRRCDNALRRQ